MRSLRLLFHGLLLSMALLTGCSQREATVQERQFVAFGTLVSVTVYGSEASLVDRAVNALEQSFHRMHRDWHAWEPGPLVQLNQALATEGRATVPAALLQLLESAQRLSIASGGLFNPAAGRLFELWGFHSDEPPRNRPSNSTINAWLETKPSMADLELHGAQAIARNSAIQLDLGAFAKGYAAHQGGEVLRHLGIRNALVAVAGDIRAIGARGERPWRIGVRHPRGQGVIASTELLNGESISTSGDYERFFEVAGIRYHHLLDPRTGQPASGLASVTVIAKDGGTADAGASALFIAGREDWPGVARAMGLEEVMLVDVDGNVEVSPAMAERMRLETDRAPSVRVRDLPL